MTALVLLIWGPLLVMSVISSNGQSNEPTEVSIRLTLSGYEVGVWGVYGWVCKVWVCEVWGDIGGPYM